MEYPILFPLRGPIESLPVEKVRELANKNGFMFVPNKPGRSELWRLPVPHGYAFLRLDETGHGGRGPGSQPHRHKEWVPREYLGLYMRGPADRDEKQKLAQVVVLYTDQGIREINTHFYDSPNATQQEPGRFHIPSR